LADNIKVGMVQINNSFSGQNYLPLSLGFLYSYASIHVSEFDKFEFLDPIYKRIKVQDAVEHLRDADIAAFSTYVWNHNLSLAIAKQLKVVNPNCLIVFGGCHVPDNGTDKYLQKYDFIDIAAIGEGERVFADLLDNFHNKEWSKVPSITYRNEKGSLITNSQCERIKDMNEIPSPFLEGYFDNLIKNNPSEKWIGLWETNRGCPFSCAYCDWGVGFKKKVQKYSLEDRLFLEADWFSKNKIEFIFCCDANFGMYKDRDYSIAKRFADNKKKFGYPHALSVQNTKNNSDSSYEVQKLLATSGLSKGVLIAFESVHKPTLKAIKRHNIKLDHFFELQRKFTHGGIKTFSDLILGLPEETCESFIEGTVNLIERGQHNRIQFNNLSILPNTEMANPEYMEKYQIQVVESDIINIHGTLETEEISESQQMVVGTKTMNGEDWVRARYFASIVGFLYFNKIFQIPITIANSVFDVDYRVIFDAFINFDFNSDSALCKIQKRFYQHAKDMQLGGPEFCPSKEWLNVYWPPDELAFIEVVAGGEIEEFYNDAKNILCEALRQNGAEDCEEIIDQAVLLNKSLIKLPNKNDKLEIVLDYNILEIYDTIMSGNKARLLKGNYTYFIDRTVDTWNSWDEWCEKVVWWCNKKGAYLYECTIDDSSIKVDIKEPERNPFGNDARYQ
tara:strand:- start:1156 stop:3180 length:2025 start_codon:yes stop_codon:yes gene_type:complete